VELNCQKRTFTQQLDHFKNSSSSRSNGSTFKQVYWVCDDAWPKSKAAQREVGHIIFFLGNESPLGVPRQPIVFENARRMHALVVELEHRYYGESMPFAPKEEGGMLETWQYQWLTVQQVIHDSVTVLEAVRSEMGVPREVPVVVIGGSYGGMLATWHRITQPQAFDAAIAASAPIDYVFGTRFWRAASGGYHTRIAAAARVMSHGKECGRIVHKGLEMVLVLGASLEGKQKILDAFNRCGNASEVLPGATDVFQFAMDQYNSWAGFAQVNNQPPLLSQMAAACEVIVNATAAGGSPMEAVAAVDRYFYGNASGACTSYNATGFLLVDPEPAMASYSYQCCTQGTVYSSELGDSGDKKFLMPGYNVTTKELREECVRLFGPDVLELQSPGFARHTRELLAKLGGVVFTNGDLDGWAGGSLLGPQDFMKNEDRPAAAAAELGGEGHRSESLRRSRSSSVSRGRSNSRHRSRGSSSSWSLKWMGVVTSMQEPREQCGAHGWVSAGHVADWGLEKGVQEALELGSEARAIDAAWLEGGGEAPKGTKGAPARAQQAGSTSRDRKGYGRLQQHFRGQEQGGHDQRQQVRAEGMVLGHIPMGLLEEVDKRQHGKLAYVMYEGASHCTDTHSFAWKTPGQPPEWECQRGVAMEYAATFMAAARDARRQAAKATVI
jgi:hypothetical protein